MVDGRGVGLQGVRDFLFGEVVGWVMGHGYRLPLWLRHLPLIPYGDGVRRGKFCIRIQNLHRRIWGRLGGGNELLLRLFYFVVSDLTGFTYATINRVACVDKDL